MPTSSALKPVPTKVPDILTSSPGPVPLGAAASNPAAEEQAGDQLTAAAVAIAGGIAFGRIDQRSSAVPHRACCTIASAHGRRTHQTEIRRRRRLGAKSRGAQRRPLPEARPSAAEDIAAFVAKARAMSPHRAGARGRLVFALDATMSRQPTWDMACALQADMFREAAALGSLDIRLVYYRGLNECRATGWISDSAQLARLMGKIDCQGGNTQIGKVLSEARREAVASGVRAVVFVGDAMEEAVDDLCAKAGELGLLKVPVFMFQEGHDAAAEQAFREIARLTGGAWCRFDPGAAAQLRELLRAAAAYAAGGREALLRLSKTGRRRGQADRPDEVIAASLCHGWPAMLFGADAHYIAAMPTLIAGVVAVVLLYLLLQMFRAANPVVLARGIKIVGGVVALAVAAFTGLRGELAVAIPLGIFGAGLLGWSPFGPAGFSNIGGIFGGGAQRSAGQASRVRSQFLDMTPRSRQRRAVGPDRGRAECRPLARRVRSAAAARDDGGLRRRERGAYLKAIWTAGFPPGVRTRKETRQGGSAARRRAEK